MKHPFLKLPIAIILLVSCNSIKDTSTIDKSKENDLELNNFKGKIKSIWQFSIKIKEQKNNIEKEDTIEIEYYLFNKEGYIYEIGSKKPGFYDEKKTTKYNKEGYVLEENSYESNNLIRKSVYKLDNAGNIIEEKILNSFNIPLSNCTYKYNKKGYRVEKHLVYPQGKSFKSKYKYNENGNKAEKLQYNSDNFMFSKTTFKYDDSSNLIELTNHLSDKEYLFKYIYEYDNNGNNIKESEYKYDGSVKLKTFKYDDKNNTIELIHQPDSNQKEKITYNRIYDNKNNWILFTSSVNGVSKVMLKRRIEYYK